MSHKELIERLQDDSPSVITTTKTPSHLDDSNRVALAVIETGYMADKNGKPREYLLGQKLNPGPEDLDSDGNQNLYMVRLQTVDETATRISSKKTPSINTGNEDSIRSNTKRHHSVRPGLLKTLGMPQPDEGGVAAVIVDFPAVDQVHAIKKDGKEARVIELSANYVQKIAAPYNDNRVSQVDVRMGRMVYTAGGRQADGVKRDPTVAFEALEDGVEFRLAPYYSQDPNTGKKIINPEFKEQRPNVIGFMLNALSNKEEPGTNPYYETAARTGFVLMDMKIISKDGNFERIHEFDGSQNPLYPSRDPLAPELSFDPATGEEVSINTPIDATGTLKRLVTCQDKATQDFLANPSNPELERRAKVADMQRTVLHAISGRHTRPEEYGGLAIAVTKDPEHQRKMEILHQSAIDGNLVLSLAKGTKYEFTKGYRDQYVGYMSEIYNEKMPNNTNQNNFKSTKRPPRVFKTMMEFEKVKNDHGGESSINVARFAPTLVSKITITTNTKQPGTWLANQINPMHPTDIKRGENMVKLDVNKVKDNNFSYTHGQGVIGYKVSPIAREFVQTQRPLHKTVDDAMKWHKDAQNRNFFEGTHETKQGAAAGLVRDVSSGKLIDPAKAGSGLNLDSLFNEVEARKQNTNNSIANISAQVHEIEAKKRDVLSKFNQIGKLPPTNNAVTTPAEQQPNPKAETLQNTATTQQEDVNRNNPPKRRM